MSDPPFNLIPRPPHNSKPWEAKSSSEKYNTMCSWFLGHRGENAGIMKETMNSIVDQVKAGRMTFGSDDEDFITTNSSDSTDFKDSVADLQAGISFLGKHLSKHSVPFFSPRYAAHMNSDISMPATLGYLIAQQYNQNNAAPEGGPFSSYIEWRVGQHLCAMVGYNSYFNSASRQPEDLAGWGHITACGSIANLESMWIARNIKYYPLALKQSMAPGAPFAFVAPTFNVNLCTGAQKNLYSCDTWELLNLSPTEVADIPTRLSKEYGISPSTLAKQFEKFSIQSVGKERLDADFNIIKPPQYMISVTNNYSWPKASAITGIGRDNLITIGVDDDARLDMMLLKSHLQRHLNNKQAVYCVVMIAGTTEHGSVDPLSEIFELRKSMEKQGMSFVIHVDAAWGGYFAIKAKPGARRRPEPEGTFSMQLNDWSYNQLRCLGQADTITLDPHKSGYVPYPAGGLCIRDERHRFLTTWTSPFINVNQGNDIAMGIYGVEGSKPGAAPIAVFLSHEVIGLFDGGYEYLLGAAMLTSVKMYSHWATMSLESSTLTVTPFKMLPVERKKHLEGQTATPEEIKKEQEEIHSKVVKRRDDELEYDEAAIDLIKQLGSDTMVNAFACNFKFGGKVNRDVVEANFLNTRIYQRLSVQTVTDDLKDRPIIILRTELKQADYLRALDNFKSRIGLFGPENLVVLSNVSMSPFPTTGQFLTKITDGFRLTAEEEIKNCLVRIRNQPSIHSFIVQGSNAICLVYLPMFNVVNHCRQVIATGRFSDDAMKKYVEAKNQNRDTVFTMHTKLTALSDLKTLDQIINDKKFVGDMYEGLPNVYGSSPFLENIEFTITAVHTNKPLDRTSLGPYPTEMPFILYGTLQEYHIDHALGSAPNAQLTASGVTLDVTPVLDNSKKYTLTFDKHVEWAMQPFTCSQPLSFFKPNATFDITVRESNSTSVSKGTLTLSKNIGDIFVDYEHLNEEIAADIYVMVPVDSTKLEQQIRTDIDNISKMVVSLFQSQNISWSMNVPSAIRRKLAIAAEYSITLGMPDASMIKPGTYFVIVSRFISKQPTRKSAQHVAWEVNFEQVERADVSNLNINE